MKFKTYFILLFLLTLGAVGVVVYFFIKNEFNFAWLFFIVTLVLIHFTLKAIFKVFRDIDDFVEAVKYRDFSKRYSETGGRRNNLFKYFNEISDTFLAISREKEAQQQYQKKILELVNTGILAYDTDTLETLWMNDSFKNMFQIPYVKNVNWLKKRHPKLYDELNGIQLGENRLTSINVGTRTIKTLSSAATFQTDGKTYLLIAFHNIGATLEEVESGAWKGLLNVMTHEIMNSIAPVASLADTLKKRMEVMKAETALRENPDFEDMESAMETIRRRSEGLLRFADTYRNLSRNIVPELHPVNLHELLGSIYRLMHPSLQQKGILLEVKTDIHSSIANIDRNLIEQVIINFITNATHAVKDREEPHIILFSGTIEEVPYITVADNGCGISPEIQERMFIPFFTSRKSGTGIGLSLSREIVKMHGASLQVQTKDGEGSAFTVLFRK
jgi:nitrogen fixation/metabolism regulation signal transduction histidine kinase